MRNLLQFGVLVALVSSGASNAQELRLAPEKSYNTINGYQVEPYVAGLSERLHPFEKESRTLNPEGTWKNRMVLGAQGRANGMEFKTGVVLNAKRQFMLELKY
jgi:hypothetical protein